jgi:hypothetical protein
MIVLLAAWSSLLLAPELGINSLSEGSDFCCQGSWEMVTPYQRMVRAGKPYCVSRLAHRSNERSDCGYYVGGGAPCRGEARSPHEGTWGWDYDPCFTRVQLKWYHGRCYQGGEGQYEPDRCNNPLKQFLGKP